MRIIHRGTDPSKWWFPEVDYDYVAQIEAVSLPDGVIMQLEDPDGILGYHGDSNTPNGVFDAEGKVAYVNLIKPNLTIYNAKNGSQVPDADEESLGAYLLVNWDDDNNNNTPDLEESNTGSNENDLARLELSLLPTGLNIGTLELIKTGGNVKIWSGSNKQSEVTDLIWNLESETPPSTLWLEGTEASGAERDVQLELQYTYESSQVSDTVKATVVMLNLGNAVYRENHNPLLTDRGHAAVVTEYTGACTKNELNDATKFKIIESAPGGISESTLNTITVPDDEAWGSFTKVNLNYNERLKVIKTAQALDADNTIGWCDEALDHEGLTWDKTLDDIDDLRCDGLVEVCYEYHDIDVWGRKSGLVYLYDIFDYLDEHNSTWGAWQGDMQPATQCAHENTYQGTVWQTTFTPQDLCTPVGHLGR